MDSKNKKWYDVTITESYHATYHIEATSQEEADEIANDAVNCGVVDPTIDGGDSYSRSVYVEEGVHPDKEDMLIRPEGIE